MGSTPALHEHSTVEYFINVLETEPAILFKQVELDFLTELPPFREDPRGRDKIHEAPELLRGLLYCYYRGIHGPRPITRKLQDASVWRLCGFERAPSLGTVYRFFGDLNQVVHHVFCRLGEQAVAHGLLAASPIYCIDSTDVRADPRDPDAQLNYDATRGEFYYGYGCTLVAAQDNLPIAAAFTQTKQIDEATAMRVTKDALAVKKPTVMIGDSGVDILAWHALLLEQEALPVARYNPRNTADPLPIKYRVEAILRDRYECLRPSRSWLDQIYSLRSRIENTINICKQYGLGTLRVRGHERARTHVYLALCVRLLVALANADRNGDPAKTFIDR